MAAPRLLASALGRRVPARLLGPALATRSFYGFSNSAPKRGKRHR